MTITILPVYTASFVLAASVALVCFKDERDFVERTFVTLLFALLGPVTLAMTASFLGLIATERLLKRWARVRAVRPQAAMRVTINDGPHRTTDVCVGCGREWPR